MSFLKRIAPGITVMFLAPLLTEVLPGATRFGSIVVFPIEMCVWGGGALLIRATVRKWQLPWVSMLLMAIALAVAEECIIQQTSLAPMVIRLKGITYARSSGVNYVYFLWALIYEPIYVVFLSTYLAELIYPKEKTSTWVNKTGGIIVSIFFLLGSFLAWFSWTQIARPKVFHMPVYHPPVMAVTLAFGFIVLLIFIALRLSLKSIPSAHFSLKPISKILLFILSAVWAMLLYCLVILAFGQFPHFPPAAAVTSGLILAIAALYFVPHWTENNRWSQMHIYWLIFGVMAGSMLISFVGFIGSTNADFYFKLITNIIASGFFIVMGVRLNKQSVKI